MITGNVMLMAGIVGISFVVLILAIVILARNLHYMKELEQENSLKADYQSIKRRQAFLKTPELSQEEVRNTYSYRAGR